MRIPLDLARTLAAVVDAGTFEAAAADLSVTPSAVSQRVKLLEQRLGRVLVVRSKPVRTTEAGAAVVRLARQLALLEHDTLVAFGGADATSARPTTVSLAVNADSLATWFLPALARIAEQHPVVFDLHRHDQDYTAELLESGVVMGAVTSQSTPVAGCVVRPLGMMRYIAVATPEWAARWCPDGAAAATLAVAPRVDFDRNDDLQAQYLRQVGADGAEAPRHLVPASNDFATAIKLGLGWGLLPGFQSDAELERGDLVALGGPPVDVPLYWQQWNLGSPLLDAIANGITRDARATLAPPREG